MAPNTEREEPIAIDEQLDLGKLAREKGAYMVYPDVKVSKTTSNFLQRPIFCPF